MRTTFQSPSKQQGRSGAKPAGEESFSVPERARGHLLAGFAMSARLANILHQNGFRVLGDLHGMRFEEFLSLRNCGAKALQEMRRLVRSAERGDPPAQRGLLEAKWFFVPAAAHDLNPFDLPLSTRLESALRRKKINRLSKLHGLPLREFWKVRNCSKTTINELIELLDRVAAGEFQASTKPFSPSAAGELLRSIKQILAKLPARQREILLMRFGAKAEGALTFEQIGSRFGVSRQAIWELLNKTLTWMAKEGGPRLTGQLKGLASYCRDMGCVLTPGLLSQWLARRSAANRWPPAFYLRLLTELEPNIPASTAKTEPR